jgi:hypothetical protein
MKDKKNNIRVGKPYCRNGKTGMILEALLQWDSVPAIDKLQMYLQVGSLKDFNYILLYKTCFIYV